MPRRSSARARQPRCSATEPPWCWRRPDEGQIAMNAVPNNANADIAALMSALGRDAVAAAGALALATADTKNRALAQIAASLRARVGDLLAANALDMEA